MAHYIPPPEKVGNTSPVSPTKLHPWSQWRAIRKLLNFMMTQFDSVLSSLLLTQFFTVVLTVT